MKAVAPGRVARPAGAIHRQLLPVTLNCYSRRRRLCPHLHCRRRHPPPCPCWACPCCCSRGRQCKTTMPPPRQWRCQRRRHSKTRLTSTALHSLRQWRQVSLAHRHPWTAMPPCQAHRRRRCRRRQFRRTETNPQR